MKIVMEGDIESLKAQVIELARTLGVMPSENAMAAIAIAKSCRHDRSDPYNPVMVWSKIQAIKNYRLETGVGLREAKEIICGFLGE